jgi:crotonobetainyl-CoA:carnitine CoA-transferase CaiB-like acyl-CoA transferase
MQPLEGIRVVEVSMWAFVPSAGAMLADMGADVVKIEPPEGDPIRGLVMAGIPPGTKGLTFMWEIFNRGKRSVAIDLRRDTGQRILRDLVRQADVFLVSLLPDARRRLGIDLDDIKKVNPLIIYAAGSGQGAFGDEAGEGGYDAMTFWARGGVAAAVTPDGHHPVGMPTGAFGDSLSGAIFAGGIAAAIAHRARTGEATTVDGSLLASAMWAMQAGIVGSSVIEADALPKMTRDATANPLVGTYRTKDDRYVALNMLQPDRYWPPLCEAIGRPDLIDHPTLGTAEKRAEHIHEALAELDAIFATKTLAEWRDILARQPGQWDVLKKMGELRTDPQALANRYIQTVDYGDGRKLEMVAAPVQFGRSAANLRPAPELGADTDAVLAELGMTEEQILDARVDGALA